MNVNEIEFYYDDVARSLISGDGFVHSTNPRPGNQEFGFKPGTPFHYVPPLYAWWLYLIYSIFGPNIFLAKVLQCFIDVSVCILIYRIGKSIFDRKRVALVSAGLYAFYPLAIYMCTTLYYQIPLNLILCWLILCFIAPVTLKNGIWTGVALGLSALAKPVTLPLIMLMPMVRIGERLWKGLSLRSALAWSIALVFASLLTLTPWTIRNYSVFHKFVPIQHGSSEAIFQGSREDFIDMDVASLRLKHGDYGIQSKDRSKAAVRNHLRHLKNAPLDYFRFLSKKFLLTWFNTEGKQKNLPALFLQLPFLSLALISLLVSHKFWLKRPNWYLPALVFYNCAIQVAIFPLVRYTLAFMPLVMLMTAAGIDLIMSYRITKTEVE